MILVLSIVVWDSMKLLNNGTYFKQHVSAWSEARYKDGKIITAPALSKSETASHKPNNYYFQDKSFARLKNVEIGYTLPQNQLLRRYIVVMFVFMHLVSIY